MSARGVLRGAVVGALASVPASYVKAVTEPGLQRAAERLLPPEPWQKRLVGADPAGRPENMPPAVVAAEVDELRGGPGLDTDEKIRASRTIHYAFGAVTGTAYGAAAASLPWVARGGGAPAGLALYALTHGTALPVLEIQEPPWDLPRSAVLWEAASHVVFGLTLEVSRRVVDRLLP
ncbi:DUF1440 domain-containing protein [Mumia sp. zg.B53]|uniref:DUF1440 domain-containing protein n=1 Tax=Mumia sp. zg.B53 TaxID=2855449 RepID=UPI001C6DFC46|nr:DUF1440 domain-containing protein [Mumia sp. zg.B53]MBW9214191.1 DUF1440 domain-containing protein [Mumia sp. zg.B53]